MTNFTRRTLALPAVFAIALAVSACGNDTSDDAPAGDTQGTPVTTVGGDSQTAASPTSAADDADPAAEVRVLIDGQPVDADLSRTQCEWGEDEGAEQLEFDAGRDDEGKLDVEIVMQDPPKLDDFEYDAPGDEDWEAEDHHRQSAQIGVEGDTYTVTSTVENDDDDSAPREAQMVAVFTCPR